MAKLLDAENPDHLQIFSEAIRNGGAVAIPTETVYGLAADAFNVTALTKVFAAKDRPTFDPLITHVSASFINTADGNSESPVLAMLSRIGLVDAARLNPKARDVFKKLTALFWPGPLTIVLPKTPKVPDLCTSGLDTVAVRMPSHATAEKLITLCNTPLAAPSANRFGRISPTCANDVQSELGDRIDYIVDGGSCVVGLESTVVHLSSDGTLTLLRPGAITQKMLENCIGTYVQYTQVHADAKAGLTSPGQLASHYAPKKNMLLFTPGKPLPIEVKGKKIALMLMSKTSGKPVSDPAHTEYLSDDGSLTTIAQNLFRILRKLDSTDADLILAEKCPTDEGLGHAITDRMNRAAAK